MHLTCHLSNYLSTQSYDLTNFCLSDFDGMDAGFIAAIFVNHVWDEHTTSNKTNTAGSNRLLFLQLSARWSNWLAFGGHAIWKIPTFKHTRVTLTMAECTHCERYMETEAELGFTLTPGICLLSGKGCGIACAVICYLFYLFIFVSSYDCAYDGIPLYCKMYFLVGMFVCHIRTSFLEKNDSHHPYKCCNVLLFPYILCFCVSDIVIKGLCKNHVSSGIREIFKECMNFYWNWTTWLNWSRRKSSYHPHSFIFMFLSSAPHWHEAGGGSLFM
jgi:hypothetical protein